MAEINSQAKKDAYNVTIDIDKCKGCSFCIIVCPVNHLKFSDSLNKRGVVYAIENSSSECIGCGHCFFMCPECCIKIKRKAHD
jgi:2-oxoglutarate ferredoxin oxidoreductase subunit delta